MKIQVISDTHFEFYKNINFENIILPQCDILFLAGDICQIGHLNYKRIIEYCSENWKNTFVILGNHEYYSSNKTHDVLYSKYKDLFNEFTNVHLLEKDIIKLDKKWTIIGCTLWSYIDNTQIDVVRCPTNIKRYIKNKYIEDGIRKVSIGIETYNKWFIDSKEWLQKSIANCETKNIIILTHYPITHKNVLQDNIKKENISEERKCFCNRFKFK
tara:strand:- start:2595 stop:3236 length:642 start_codon:yes stop_codon:yes gene_type:complete